MILRRPAALFATVLLRSAPLTAIAALVASAPACTLLASNTRTNVADGRLYEPGEADFDAFFKDLYDIQLVMGQGPAREAKFRAELASSLGIAETSSIDDIGDAVYQRAASLAKAGAMVKISISGVGDGATPSATVVTIGEIKDEKDVKLVETLDKVAKEDADLLQELRKSRPPLEKLRGKAVGLDPRIDSTFSSRSKRAEVRKNLDDARQLLPLMVSRSDELEHKATHFLTQLQKVLGSPTSAGGPTALPEETPKKGKGGKARPAGKAAPAAKAVNKPSTPPRAVPKPDKTEAPKKADAPKPTPEAKKAAPAKAATEDFEP
jgi:hypothetical protein